MMSPENSIEIAKINLWELLKDNENITRITTVMPNIVVNIKPGTDTKQLPKVATQGKQEDLDTNVDGPGYMLWKVIYKEESSKPEVYKDGRLVVDDEDLEDKKERFTATKRRPIGVIRKKATNIFVKQLGNEDNQ